MSEEYPVCSFCEISIDGPTHKVKFLGQERVYCLTCAPDDHSNDDLALPHTY